MGIYASFHERWVHGRRVRVISQRQDVPLPYNFFTRRQWQEAFAEIGVVESDRRERFGLYPRPATLLFERRMHFACRLTPR